MKNLSLRSFATLYKVKEDIKPIFVDSENKCPDFDDDCKTMTNEQASWCFHGCQNHKCNPGSNLGTAKGYCPMITKDN